jgi:hypothetical protein
MSLGRVLTLNCPLKAVRSRYRAASLPVINLARNFPSLEPFSLGVVGFTTLLYCVFDRTERDSDRSRLVVF